MAKFRNFSADQQVTVDKVYRASRLTLERAVKDFDSTKFRQTFAEVMGAGAGARAAEEVLKKELTNMFMRIGTLSFSVEYDAGLGAHTNANMLSFAGASPDEVTNTVDSYRSGAGVADMMPMKLGPPFFAMPYSSLTQQSQIETFIHELSHHAAGAIDDTNGGECYGQTGVTRLMGLGAARAVRNAENIGWFCMRYA